jgi:hypothetical protein
MHVVETLLLPSELRKNIRTYEAEADKFRHRGRDGLVTYYEDCADAARRVLEACEKVAEE